MERLDVDIELELGAFRLELAESIPLEGITAIFGASGSGKTSLLRVIAGLEPAARGTIRMRGQTWLDAARRLPPEARKLGLVFQERRLFSHLDVRRNLLFPIAHGRRRGPIDFASTVEALDLDPLLGRYPGSLSGGEAQRVAIGRALLADPALLIMDEPASSLDLPRKRELLPLIKTLAARFELPILYVTHDIDELAYLADRVVMLAGGRKVASGSAREILAMREFARLSAIDDPGAILEARIEAQEDGLTVAALDAGTIRLPQVPGPPGARISLRIDPRDVILATVAPSGLSIRNRLAAVIREIEDRGDGLMTVWLNIGEQELAARITLDAAEDLKLKVGQRVFALVKTAALEALGHS